MKYDPIKMDLSKLTASQVGRTKMDLSKWTASQIGRTYMKTPVGKTKVYC
jgi:hypothetical protein